MEYSLVENVVVVVLELLTVLNGKEGFIKGKRNVVIF